MNFSSSDMMDNLYIPANRTVENDFEQQYILLRCREQRIYTDKELFHLPEIAADHPHFNEWLVRKSSCRKLKNYLESKNRGLSILEVGCGNGWLSYELSRIPGSKVIGIDINLTELQQAARVFNKNSKLKFVYGDIFSGLLNDLKFDAIVFAASIQYFPVLTEILNVSLNQLYPRGEIHITDSPIYKPAEVDAARERTRDYYNSLDFPEMTNHYFHHSITEFAAFQYKILHNPYSIKNRFLPKKQPFYWICIEKK